VTAGNFVGNFLGNITGNLSVGGSNTQVLFNNNGNVGAAGGLTYNSGSNTLGILGVVSAQGNITTGANITVTTNAIVGGNLRVTGTTQLIGVATAPTATTGAANNQVATTAFVTNQINSVAGNVGTTNWSLRQVGSDLYFQFNSSNVARLDQSGNFTTIGNVTGFGTL
jgi:hypothetical protein